MIWIIGGTSETAELLALLKGKVAYQVTVATQTGRELLTDDHVTVGRMNEKKMGTFIKTHQITKIVDLSHPYAVEVSKNAIKACDKYNLSYFRYLRESADTGSEINFTSLSQCVDFLKTVQATVYFTTGSKNIHQFQKVRGKNRFVYRVLPVENSIHECRINGLGLEDIVAIQGPFSKQLNIALFKEVKADYIVMKNSGPRGGTQEKIEACQELNIKPLIISRPKEDGFADLTELAKLLIAGYAK